MAGRDHGIHLVGLTVADPPEAWTAAGFAVGPDGICWVGEDPGSTVAVRLVGPGSGILDWSLAGIDGAALVDGTLDGLPTFAAEEPSNPSEPAEHPNGVLGIDHVVVLSPDTARTTDAFRRAGMEPRRVREAGTRGSPILQTFFRAGAVIVELVGPPGPADTGPATFFGLAHTVADLDAVGSLLGGHLGRPKAAVQPGRRIATLRHRELGLSVATAFMSPEPG